MNDTVIAIRTADGSWFPVLDRHSGGRKRVILTTARANQERVNIDMYEGPRDDLSAAEYIGSLVIEGIEPGEAGEVEIEFLAGVDDHNNLRAQATNRASGDSQSLSVSLLDRESLPEEPAREPTGDMPDFSMDEDEESDAFQDYPEAEEFSEDFSFDDELPQPASPDTESADFTLDDDLPEPESLEAVGSGALEPSGSEPSGSETTDSETTDSESSDEDAYDLSSQLEEPPIFDMPDDFPEEGFDELSSEEQPEGFIAETEELEPDYSGEERAEEYAGTTPEYLTDSPSEDATEDASPRRPSAAFFVVYMVLALGILAGVVYLIYSAFQAEPIPPLESARSVFAALPFFTLHRGVWRWR